MRFDPQTEGHRRVPSLYQSRERLGAGPGGELYGAQEGGRRLVEFTPDGRLVAVDALLDGKYHNQPATSWSTAGIASGSLTRAMR